MSVLLGVGWQVYKEAVYTPKVDIVSAYASVAQITPPDRYFYYSDFVLANGEDRPVFLRNGIKCHSEDQQETIQFSYIDFETNRQPESQERPLADFLILQPHSTTERRLYAIRQKPLTEEELKGGFIVGFACSASYTFAGEDRALTVSVATSYAPGYDKVTVPRPPRS